MGLEADQKRAMSFAEYGHRSWGRSTDDDTDDDDTASEANGHDTDDAPSDDAY